MEQPNSPVLDLDLRDLALAYNTFVLQADECVRVISAWYLAAHGRNPMRHDMHHIYWRIIAEREHWGTMRVAMETTWPISGSIPPTPPIPPIIPPTPPIPPVIGEFLIRVTPEQDGRFAPRTMSDKANAWVSYDRRWAYVFAGSQATGGPLFYQVDLETGKVDSLGPKMPYGGETDGWYWAPNGTVMLIRGPQLHRFNPFTGNDDVVLDISALLPGHDLWQAHSSDDGSTHSATVRWVSGDVYPYVGTVITKNGRMRFIETVGKLDESQVARGGNHIVIEEKIDGSEDNRIFSGGDDVSTWTERRITDAQGAIAHSDCGPSFIVGEANLPEPGRCVLVDLETLERTDLFQTWNMGYMSARGGRLLHSGEQHIRLIDRFSGAATHQWDHGANAGNDYDRRVKAALDHTGSVFTYMIDGVMYLRKIA